MPGESTRLPRIAMSRRLLLLPIALLTLLGVIAQADDPPKEKPAVKRVPWTTSKVFGSPEPPSPYKTEYAFPKLKFDEPLDLNFGMGRLFVVERYGYVYSLPVTDRNIEKADLLIDLNEHYG